MRMGMEEASRWHRRGAGPLEGFETQQAVDTAAERVLTDFLEVRRGGMGCPVATPLVSGSSTLKPFRIDAPGHAASFAKVAVNAQQRTVLSQESAWAAVASKLGVAPRLIACAPGVLLTEFVDARQFEQADMGDVDALRRVFAQLVKLHRAAPSSTLAMPENVALHPQARIRASLAQARRLGRITHGEARFMVTETERAFDALAAMQRAACPTHGDFQKRNILLGEHRAWVIDYEDTGHGEPMTDLAHFAAEFFTPYEELPRLARLYCEVHRDCDGAATLRALQLCFHMYALFRHLSRIKREPDEQKLDALWATAHTRSTQLWQQADTAP